MSDNTTTMYRYMRDGMYLYTPNLRLAIGRRDEDSKIISYKYYPAGLNIDVEKTTISITTDENEDDETNWGSVVLIDAK